MLSVSTNAADHKMPPAAGSDVQDARLVPAIVPGTGGKVDGFRFAEIAPGSTYAKSGFKKNDVIKTINGEKVDSPQKAMEFYNVLKSGKTAKVVIERDGKEQELTLKAN